MACLDEGGQDGWPGLMAALMMGGGLGGLAGPAAASAAAACPAWDGTQPAVPGTGNGSELLAVTAAGPCDVWTVGDVSTDHSGSRATVIEHWTGGPAWNCTVPRGIVLSQNPSAGSTAAPGTPVSLTESTGRAVGGRPCL